MMEMLRGLKACAKLKDVRFTFVGSLGQEPNWFAYPIPATVRTQFDLLKTASETAASARSGAVLSSQGSLLLQNASHANANVGSRDHSQKTGPQFRSGEPRNSGWLSRSFLVLWMSVHRPPQPWSHCANREQRRNSDRSSYLFLGCGGSSSLCNIIRHGAAFSAWRDEARNAPTGDVCLVYQQDIAQALRFFNLAPVGKSAVGEFSWRLATYLAAIFQDNRNSLVRVPPIGCRRDEGPTFGDSWRLRFDD
jgi:hypothetical protein